MKHSGGIPFERKRKTMSTVIQIIQSPTVRRIATEITLAAARKAVELAGDALKDRRAA